MIDTEWGSRTFRYNVNRDHLATGRARVRKGQRQTDEAKRRMSETKLVPLEERIESDREALRLLGQTDRYLWSEKFGCSEATATLRLSRLVEAGYASKFRQRGANAYTYVATVAPGDIQIVNRRRRRPESDS
jgi:Fic family protein